MNTVSSYLIISNLKIDILVLRSLHLLVESVPGFSSVSISVLSCTKKNDLETEIYFFDSHTLEVQLYSFTHRHYRCVTNSQHDQFPLIDQLVVGIAVGCDRLSFQMTFQGCTRKSCDKLEIAVKYNAYRVSTTFSLSSKFHSSRHYLIISFAIRTVEHLTFAILGSVVEDLSNTLKISRLIF